MSLAGATLAVPVATPAGAMASPTAPRTSSRTADGSTPFARGVRAFRGGAYADAETAFKSALATPATAKHKVAGTRDRTAALLNVDWATYLQAESAFYAGHVATARAQFESLVRTRSGRFGGLSAFRVADCLWAEGDHAGAVAHYRKLPGRPPVEIDPAVGRFRTALLAAEQQRSEASRLFLAFYRDFPAHPWASEALRHLPPAGADVAAANPSSPPPAPIANGPSKPSPIAIVPADHLRRAETLSHDRNWNEALSELALLPRDLPAGLAAERDYQIGMTKFHMRRDYAGAAALLLAAAPALTGDKAAAALFHGTRALSRIDRDDEAIAGYKQVVARFPASRFAAEAQFLSGWLDYNRGRYRESLPGLRETVERFGQSAFADDAAWCLAFAHYLLGEVAEATRGFDRYARMPPTGMTGDEQAARVAYWRARLASKDDHTEQAQNGYREVNRRWPFTFYGVAARARLAEWGLRVAIDLPAPAPEKRRTGKESTSPIWARIHELAAAGLGVEAGWELERAEKSLLGPRGAGAGAGDAETPAVLAMLLREYAALKNFHRAYELAESRQAGAALTSAPIDGARPWWEAAYPRAYREWVEQYGPGSGNPDVLLYAIMRKESGFSPWDVSVADARGLLQMIPPTSAQVAKEVGLDFAPDELYDPEVNIRLGALYIGGLAKKFHDQIPLVAGAYNAGPKAMAKWCDQHGRQPTDEFIELIAFTQTREYAKRVVGIYARYRHLYGPTEYVQPLSVNPRYAAGGPDY